MIRPVDARDLADLRALYRAYADWLAAAHGHDLYAQGLEAELAALPGTCAPPCGGLLIAREEGVALGCVGFRQIAPGVAELKRLYVVPEARGQALGRALVLAAMEAARAAGHRRVVLDSLPTLTAAHALYRALGFTDIAPYHDAPDLVFMGRAL